MDTILILKSETYAYKGKKLLSRMRISARIIKTVDENNGCVFGITVKKDDIFRVIQIFRNNGIDYKLKI